jgi:hypothetical protein
MNTTTLRPALRVRGLRKSFGDHTVLDGRYEREPAQ